MPTEGSANLRVLARRPVVFYLAWRGKVPFHLVSDLQAIEAGPGSLMDWALVDEAILPGGPVSPVSGMDHPRRFFRRVTEWSLPLDPVTRLDVNPGDAYFRFDEDRRSLVLFSPVIRTGNR
jgi:hypothetical protein